MWFDVLCHAVAVQLQPVELRAGDRELAAEGLERVLGHEGVALLQGDLVLRLVLADGADGLLGSGVDIRLNSCLLIFTYFLSVNNLGRVYSEFQLDLCLLLRDQLHVPVLVVVDLEPDVPLARMAARGLLLVTLHVGWDLPLRAPAAVPKPSLTCISV